MMKTLWAMILFIPMMSFAQNRYIQSIEIFGTKDTKTEFVERFINSKIGEKLDSTLLEEDVTRLKRLPIFSHAYYKIISVHNNSCTIQFYVEENITLIPNVNIWTSTNRQFSFLIGVAEYNLLGRGIGVGAFYQYNGYHSYSLNFRAPNLFSSSIGLALNHRNWRSIEPIYNGDNVADYLYGNISYEILGLYEINFRNRVQLGFTIFEENYDFINGNVDSSIPRNLNINKTLYKLVYDYDNLKYNHQYISGFRSLSYIQYVSSNTASQSNFAIAWNDFYYYSRITKNGVWANRLRIGLSSNDDSPFAPFALDNNINLRGVGNQIDRGTGVITLNTEYRHTLLDKDWFVLQGNLFVDAGSWRNPGGKLNDFVDGDNVRIYPGIGVRFIHKKIYNAILRIDYGKGITKNESQGIVFGVGQYF